MANIPDNGPIPNETVHSQSVELEKVHLYAQSYITEMMADYPGLSQNVKLNPIIRSQIGGLVFQMTSWCAAGRVPDTEVVETVAWPDGVWQMFKARIMPEWFTIKFPVRHIERKIKTVVNHYFVCPHIHVPEDRTHIQFMLTGTKMAERMNRL
jgi:hypothetical protein